MSSLVLRNMSIKELLDRHPQLAAVFMELGLACVGCPTEAFHTLSDIAKAYNMDENKLFHRMRVALKTAPEPGRPIKKQTMKGGIKAANMIFYCRRWKETVEFYRDRLQLPVHFSTDWFVEFQLNGKSFLSIADEKRSTIKSCGGNGVTISVEVADLDRVRDKMVTIGLNPTHVTRHPWNARLFYLFDPEGHRIELWQRTIKG